jgi:hypothetical protein
MRISLNEDRANTLNRESNRLRRISRLQFTKPRFALRHAVAGHVDRSHLGTVMAANEKPPSLREAVQHHARPAKQDSSDDDDLATQTLGLSGCHQRFGIVC